MYSQKDHKWIREWVNNNEISNKNSTRKRFEGGACKPDIIETKENSLEWIHERIMCYMHVLRQITWIKVKAKFDEKDK